MDPISTAVVAAVAQLGATAVKDAYGGLRSLLVRKFGGESRVVQAMEQVEAQPTSEGRKMVLGEEMAAVRAEHDEELVGAAAALTAALEASRAPAVSVRQTVHGNQNVFSGTGNIDVRGERP